MTESHEWIATRSAALERLTTFAVKAALLEQEVISTALNTSGEKNAQKFIQEVFWRSYWKGWLQHRPLLWHHYRSSVEHLAHRIDESPDLAAAIAQATSGQTDIELFNDWVRELLHTGYLHNHSRMWFASIWIFTLNLPWELGAEFFLQNLLDGDAASNTLSWRWVAGLHTNGKNYLATRENIEKFAPDRSALFPQGLETLATSAAPLKETPPWPTQPEALKLPAVENAQSLLADENTGLLIHEDDCGYDWRAKAEHMAALAPQPHNAQPSISQTNLATKFSSQLLRDALTPARTGERCTTETNTTEPNTTEPMTPAAIKRWATEAKLRTVITPFAPVGSSADALIDLETELEKDGVRLIRILRPYDQLVWPHASKGFFKLNKQISTLLIELSKTG